MTSEMLTNTRVGASVTTLTIGSIITQALEVLPTVISIIATCAAAVLSIVLIRAHVVKIKAQSAQIKMDLEKHKLDMALLRKQLEERTNEDTTV